MNTVYYKYHLSEFLSLKSISSFSYQVLDKNYVYKGESHDTWEFMYVDYNNVIVTVDGETFDVKHKELLVIEPNRFHTLRCNGTDDARIFVVTCSIGSKIKTPFETKTYSLNAKQINLLESIINEGYTIFNTSDEYVFTTKLIAHPKKFSGSEQVLKNYLEIFLISLHRQKEESAVIFSKDEKTDDESICNNIVKVLQNNLYNKLTLDDICEMLHYSKSLVCKKFKDKYGTTIMQYYMKLKIAEAKKHLVHNTISVENLAYNLYFCSASHFINTFKKYENISPAQYCKSIKPKFQ